MEPSKVNINPDNLYSYYLQYSDTLIFDNDTINIFAYARVSTQMQAEFGSSIDTQIQILKDECSRYQYNEDNKKIKYNLMRIYVDNGISGKTIDGRPGLVSMKNYISSIVTGRTHKKLGFLCSDLSRLTRNSENLEFLLKWIKEDAIKLKFIDTSIDPDSNAGQLMLTMLGGLYSYEVRNSSFKTKMTLRAMSEANSLISYRYGYNTGVDDNGRKINIPIPEEQVGIDEIIRIHRESPNLKPFEIKNLMNLSDFKCLRGPGRNFKGNNRSEQSIKKNELVEWTGKWSTQVIEKILDHANFDDRKALIQDKISKGEAQPVNIMKKDDIVIDLIKKHLEETNGYEKATFNYSEIARVIDSKNIFSKKIDRNYVKRMMEVARIIKTENVAKKVNNDDAIIVKIKELIEKENIMTYSTLTEKLLECNMELVGKRKKWNKTNVRDLCIKYKINI